MQPFMQAMSFRHACKKFDSQRKIPADEFQQILEFGRLSPSSFGMEQWRFVVVQTPELREKLREVCWNQPQITESSHVVVILAKTTEVEPGTEYVNRLYQRRGLPEDRLQASLERYANHHATEIKRYIGTYGWSSKQCYIALANMMTGAASLGIDSCPIEGLSKEGVEAVLNVDTSKYEVAVAVAFGYRAGEQTQCLRQPLDELVEYR